MNFKIKNIPNIAEYIAEKITKTSMNFSIYYLSL